MTPARAGTAAAALVLGVLGGLSLAAPAPLPRLGPFLDPAHGVFAVARTAELPESALADIPHLGAPVEVRYDARGVPHIFAAGELDAIRALGYVVARDRLFQLELQARAGAGTLTELVGARALPLDQETRALGLPDAADRSLAALGDTTRGRRLIEAYADGVNAWIDQLSRAQLPLEYRLLGRRPARWAPENALHLFNRMGWVLTQSDLERRKAAAAALVGTAAADFLYPVESPLQEPIQPSGLGAPRAVTGPVPGPGTPAPDTVLAMEPTGVPGSDHALGSNNWAVGPRRSATGHPLLAGDPHLELTLPSIWYEAHLVVPDSLDVHGVTIPGAPAIVIGFTRRLAWTFTNVEADLQDRWLEVVDDDASPAQYRLDGAWRPLRTRVETYRGPDGAVLAVDTLRFTHRGPLTRGADGRWVSLRWTVLEAAPALDALGAAARAPDARAWLATMRAWAAPPQNLLVADQAGHIAIRSTGRYPRRPTARGDHYLRGDTSATDWAGDWTVAEMPQAQDPPQGFVASANQQPVDPAEFPRYLGAGWLSPWRALRINALLRRHDSVTVDDMRRFQTDPGSAAAERFVPAFLAAAAARAGGDTLARAAALLAEWNGEYTVDNRRAVLFEAAVDALQERLWDELAGDSSGRRRPAPRPALVMTWRLLGAPASGWWDHPSTPRVEDRDDILAEALVAAYRAVRERHGDPAGDGWRWGAVRTVSIPHLLHLPGFGAAGLAVQGGSTTLNPVTAGGGFGASWRMVVDLGDTVRAWGTYPGGQSGNPASRRYLDRLPLWVEGDLAPLASPATAGEVGDVTATLTLRPAP